MFEYNYITKNKFCYNTAKNQALDPNPHPDLDLHSFLKPWIRIRFIWMQIRNPGYGSA